jgi:hypothetical protein
LKRTLLNRTLSLLSLGLLVASAAGCPSRSRLAAADQRALILSLSIKTLYLKHSHFTGPFFAYSDKHYLSERAYDERVLIEKPNGDPLLPAGPTGIWPMGTKVRVLSIEFPTSGVIAGRKLRSPRHFTWVEIEAADRQGDERQAATGVLVLTHEFKSRRHFLEVLDSLLVSVDPHKAFADRPQGVLSAIDHKQVLVGMRWDALLRARGHPDRVLRKESGGVRSERWVYSTKRVVNLIDGVVESAQGMDVRPARSEKAPDEDR